MFAVEFPHRFTLAIGIFDSHHPDLSQSLSDLVGVAWLLHGEGVITRQVVTSVESASPSVPKQREILLTAVREAVQTKYTLLQTFASVLCRFTDNVQLGEVIHRNYCEFVIYSEICDI